MNFILRIHRVTLILLSIFLLTPVLTQAQITSISTPVIDSFDTGYSGWTVTASQADFATSSSNTFNNTTGAIVCNQGLRCRIQKTGVASRPLLAASEARTGCVDDRG